MTKLIVRPDGNLLLGGRKFRCALGRGGIALLKKEGDGSTPAGRWPLRRVLYRLDRLGEPVTRLPSSIISRSDGWCDDPGHTDYNQPVRLPHPASCEKLWREDHVYDVIVVLGHNDDPVVAGAGSAIFLHIARSNYSPTEGCVALEAGDLLSVLEKADTGWRMEIVSD